MDELKRAYALYAAQKLRQPVTEKKEVDADAIERLLWEHGLQVRVCGGAWDFRGFVSDPVRASSAVRCALAGQHVLAVLEQTRRESGGSRGVSLRNAHVILKQLLSCVALLLIHNPHRNLLTMHAALINKYLVSVCVPVCARVRIYSRRAFESTHTRRTRRTHSRRTS